MWALNRNGMKDDQDPFIEKVHFKLRVGPQIKRRETECL